MKKKPLVAAIKEAPHIIMKHPPKSKVFILEKKDLKDHNMVLYISVKKIH